MAKDYFFSVSFSLSLTRSLSHCVRVCVSLFRFASFAQYRQAASAGKQRAQASGRQADIHTHTQAHTHTETLSLRRIHTGTHTDSHKKLQESICVSQGECVSEQADRSSSSSHSTELIRYISTEFYCTRL